MRELPSPGKSGSVFWISHDDRFFLKARSELQSLEAPHGARRPADREACARACALLSLTPCGVCVRAKKFTCTVIGRSFSKGLQVDGGFSVPGAGAEGAPLGLVQTMKRGEVELLLKLLPRYYEHVKRYPHTLLIKFFGLHRVTTASGGKVPRLNLPPPYHASANLTCTQFTARKAP